MRPILFCIILLSLPSLACDPIPGDRWFIETLEIKENPFLEINQGRLFPKKKKRCVLKDRSYEIDSEGLYYKCSNSKQIRRDHRPKDIQIPGPQKCSIDIYCDPVIKTIPLKLKYIQAKNKLYYLQIDSTFKSDFLDFHRVPLSAQGVAGISKLQTKGHEQQCYYEDKNLANGLYINDLFYKDYPSMLKKPKTIKDVPSLKVKCYQVKFQVQARLKYSLKADYQNNLGEEGAKLCAEFMK